MFVGDFGEVGIVFDGGFQFVVFGFVGNQDVVGSGLGYGEIFLG